MEMLDLPTSSRSDHGGLLHPALARGQQVEDVELRARQSEGLKESFAAAFE